MKKLCKTCGKHVYFLRIHSGEAVQKPVDFLRGTGGFMVEKWLECSRMSTMITH